LTGGLMNVQDAIETAREVTNRLYEEGEHEKAKGAGEVHRELINQRNAQQEEQEKQSA